MITMDYLKNFPYVIRIKLDSIEKINTFLDIAEHVSGEMYLYCDKKIVSATSVMGIFTLNLRRSMLLFSDISLIKQLTEYQIRIMY